MKKLTKDEVIDKFNKTHKNKYNYDKFIYINQRTKGCITCLIHGDFYMTPKNHWLGQGCPKCAKEKNRGCYRRKNFDKIKLNELKEIASEKFDFTCAYYKNEKSKITLICKECGNKIKVYPNDIRNLNIKCEHKFKHKGEDLVLKFNEIHTHKYQYNIILDKFYRTSEYIDIICEKHGKFRQTIYNHFHNGCPKCGIEKFRDARKVNVLEFKEKLNNITSNNISFNENDFVDMNKKIIFHCKVCNLDFERKPTSMLINKRCPHCHKKEIIQKRTKTTDVFKEQIKKVHGDKYDLSKTIYIKSNKKVIATCPIHGDFYIEANSFLNGHGCPFHFLHKSKQELELCEFISNIIDEKKIILSDRSTLNGLELDILIKEYNVAFEYDGLFWHSDNYKPNDYHINKTLKCNEQNINLFHIFEDEWIFKKNVVKDIIKDYFGLVEILDNENCYIKEIDKVYAKTFLETYDIKYNVTKFNKIIGIFYEKDLISLCTMYNNGKKIEINKFCHKTDIRVQDWFDLYINYIVKHENVREIKLSLDKRYPFKINLKKNDFKFVKTTKPKCYYINKNKRQLKKDDNNLKIFDCGNDVFVKTIKL